MLAIGLLLIVVGVVLVLVGCTLHSNRPAFLVGMDMTFWGLVLAIVGLVAALVEIFGPTPARAHDARSGWTYPLACCSDFDCREVGDAWTPDAAIRVLERPEGYVISSTGEVIPMTSRKVRPSPDGEFHWCSVAGKADGKTICLFVPPRAF